MFDGRITDKAPYGCHVALVCAEHPGMQWSTKNIGAAIEGRVFFSRTIFFDSHGIECDCNQSSLRLHPMYADLPQVEA